MPDSRVQAMSNYVVLVKQVPDITQIADNAFDPESGTLIRSRLVSVINELDTQALAFADHMRRISGDSAARIVCLTMGPPMAEEVLRYCLSRCADVGVLLTDKALGGADTWATANPLSLAVRKIAADIFEGDSEYYVVSGMQSVDGDTAQVPPQVAEAMGIPCLAYATDVRFEQGRFLFTQIVSGGSQTVVLGRPPAVLTVAKHPFPLFATFTASRWAAEREILRWKAVDVGATRIGVAGSKTRVIRVFPPGKSRRRCRRLQDAESLVQVIVESFRASEQPKPSDSQAPRYVLPANRPGRFDRTFEATAKEREDFEVLRRLLVELGVDDVEAVDQAVKQKILSMAGRHFHSRALDDMIAGLRTTDPSYQGQVWVVAEHSEGRLHPAVFELTGKARELADSLARRVGVLVAGADVEKFSAELIAAGADDIYLVEHDLLAAFDPWAYRKAVADCIAAHWPQIVLYAATPQGRVLAPMVSYRLDCGLTADCTGLRVRDSSRKGQIGILLQTRPALGGNVMATICTKNSKSQMATARPGVMRRSQPDTSRTGRVIRCAAELSQADVSLQLVASERASSGAVKFDAEVIVSGGKGMQNRDTYERLVGSLCRGLSQGLRATVERGASRAAVERGFVERVHQVGQTGTAVGPRLYMALGISGAIQHMIGVANSDTIVAINSDPNAPIVKQCDYYVVANVEDVVPSMVTALEAVSGK